MENVKKEFINQQIDLDSNSFRECIFKKCTLVYRGTGDVGLDSCEFHDVKWKFCDSAERVLKMLTGLYHGGAKELIEDTINNIRQGNHPT